MVELVDKLQRGAAPSALWSQYSGCVTYRTLCRWRRSGTKARRYRISKWWLENRERIDKLERRGLTRREILSKVGFPPCYRRVTGPKNELMQLVNIWRNIRSLESSENERWMGRAA
jgi:hypothetical protein